MSGSEHARPVWLTREQRDALRQLDVAPLRVARIALGIADAWDAAPADPTEAIRAVHIEYGCDHDAVLRALGHPKEPA